MNTCMSPCMHTHAHIHTCTNAHMHIHRYTHMCSTTHMHICTHNYIYVCMHLNTHTYTHIHTHMHTGTHMYARTEAMSSSHLNPVTCFFPPFTFCWEQMMEKKTDPGQSGFQSYIISVPQFPLIATGIAMSLSMIQCDDELGHWKDS